MFKKFFNRFKKNKNSSKIVEYKPYKLSDEYNCVGCDKCGAKHYKGIDKDYLECYRCWRIFSPQFQGRKYENYKKDFNPENEN